MKPNDSFTMLSSRVDCSATLKEPTDTFVPTSNVSNIKPKVLQSKPSQKRSQWAGIIDTDSEEHHKNLHSAKMELVLKEAEPSSMTLASNASSLRLNHSPKLSNRRLSNHWIITSNLLGSDQKLVNGRSKFM